MHLSAQESCHSLVLLCILLRSCQAIKNDATELLFPHSSASAGASASSPAPEAQSNVSLNRARTGGRGAGGAAQERGGEWVGGAGGCPTGLSGDRRGLLLGL